MWVLKWKNIRQHSWDVNSQVKHYKTTCNYSFGPLNGFCTVHQQKKHISDILKKEACNEYRIIYVFFSCWYAIAQGNTQVITRKLKMWGIFPGKLEMWEIFAGKQEMWKTRVSAQCKLWRSEALNTTWRSTFAICGVSETCLSCNFVLKDLEDIVQRRNSIESKKFIGPRKCPKWIRRREVEHW